MTRQKKQQKEEKNYLEFTEYPFMDNEMVIGIGSAKLKGKWVGTRVSIKKLKKILVGLEHLGMNDIMLCFSDDLPLCLGRVKNGIVSGVFLAQMEKNDENGK